jgi:hypothetical protein
MLLGWRRLRTGRKDEARNAFLDVLHQYVRHKKDKHGHLAGTVDRKNCWAAISNFFAFHKLPLPDLDDQEQDKLFRPSEADKQRAQFLGTMNVDEARLLIDNATMPYKAVLMIMLQAGFGCAEFQIFNESAWREIIKDSQNPKELKPGPHLHHRHNLLPTLSVSVHCSPGSGRSFLLDEFKQSFWREVC